jgi:ABC-type oligopeptide transport system substrate-binding subunit
MAALVVIALGSASCGQDTPQGHTSEAAKPLVLTRSIGGQPGSLDPQRAEDAFSYDVLRDLYEG